MMDTMDFVQKAAEKTTEKMLKVVERNRGKVPYNTENGVYNDYSGKMIGWWTNGFWGGILWQLYHATGSRVCFDSARELEEKMDAVLMDSVAMDHDSGFKWLPTAVADYRLTGNPASKNRALLAADNLAGRFNPMGRFIKAWNDPGTGDKAGWAIIDCMMNLPLLYWAAAETRDPKYRHIATMHADTARQHFIREDGSVKHIIEFDPQTGQYLRSHGGQGYGHGSAWTRGQGWAIYGFALSYRHTGDRKYLEAAEKVAEHFLAHIPESGLVPIDLCQPADDDGEDSIAAAVVACGLLEIFEHTGRQYYREAALKLLSALYEKRCDWSPETDHILRGCSEGYHTPKRNMSIMYGDYYWLEAIWKLTGKEWFIWG